MLTERLKRSTSLVRTQLNWRRRCDIQPGGESHDHAKASKRNRVWAPSASVAAAECRIRHLCRHDPDRQIDEARAELADPGHQDITVARNGLRPAGGPRSRPTFPLRRMTRPESPKTVRGDSSGTLRRETCDDRARARPFPATDRGRAAGPSARHRLHPEMTENRASRLLPPQVQKHTQRE